MNPYDDDYDDENERPMYRYSALISLDVAVSLTQISCPVCGATWPKPKVRV